LLREVVKLSPFLKTGEGRETVEAITYKELKQKVAVYASAMKRLGVQIGDRVVGMCTGEHNLESLNADAFRKTYFSFCVLLS